jgi:trk system potassium uptake protein
MKQFAILGLSYFGKDVVEELLELDVDIMIIDKDRNVIDAYKDYPVSAVVMDIMNEEALGRVLPKNLDGVIIDMGEKIEASILATSYCRKLGIPRIFVKAVTEGHAEILDMVGATKIIFPHREAAKRITPLLVSSGLLNYLPVSGKLVIAEIIVPERLFGLSLLEANLRRSFGVNLISVKNGEDDEYGLFTPEYRFRSGDIALVSGMDESVEVFSQSHSIKARHRLGLRDISNVFGNKKRSGQRIPEKG